MALAEPVDVGARLASDERARRRSDFLVLRASTTVCVFVTSWIVVMQLNFIYKLNKEERRMA